MSQPPIDSRGLGITARLGLLLAAVATLLMVAVAVFSWSLYRAERQANLAGMVRSASTLAATIGQVDQAGRRAAEQSFPLFLEQLPENAFTLDSSTNPARLMHRGENLSGDFTAVDRFTAQTGGVATIFVREGDDFRRISTSLKKQDGERAIGTLLDRKHPAYSLMLDAKTFVGRAVLFGTTYMTKYLPIVQDQKTIAILFIGYDMTGQLATLKESMALYATDTRRVVAIDLNAGNAFGPESVQSMSGDDAQLVAWREAIAAGQRQGLLEGVSLSATGLADTDLNVAWQHVPAWNWIVLDAESNRITTAQARINVMWLVGIVLVSLLAAGLMVFLGMKRLVGRPLKEALDAARTLAARDLSRPFLVHRSDEVGLVLNSLEDVRQQWVQSLLAIRQTAFTIDGASQDVANGNQDLSGRTEQAAGNLEETAASMEELTATVKQSADSARQANQLVSSAAESAQRGGNVMEQVVGNMTEIAQSSQRISEIIGVIDGIAFQTNILALNAAVEAARAGEQGRGFAVVAGEVRTLAQRSAQAAKEIKDLINASVTKVQDGSRLVRDAGSTMNDIVGDVQRVSDIIAEITAASSEQSEGIGQVNVAVMQLDQMTQQNAALVEQSAAAARSLTEEARRLLDVLSQFNTGEMQREPRLLS